MISLVYSKTSCIFVLINIKQLEKMKNYKLEFQDVNKNELFTKTIEENNISDARKTASKLLANSNINDLHKIKVTIL